MYMLTEAMNRKEPVLFNYSKDLFSIIKEYPTLKENEGLAFISHGDEPDVAYGYIEPKISASEIIPIGIINLDNLYKVKEALVSQNKIKEDIQDCDLMRYLLGIFEDFENAEVSPYSESNPKAVVETINLI